MELSFTANGQSQSRFRWVGASVLPSECIAHNVAMRFKDMESKFDGDLAECWSEYVDLYLQVAKDYNLSVKQKL